LDHDDLVLLLHQAAHLCKTILHAARRTSDDGHPETAPLPEILMIQLGHGSLKALDEPPLQSLHKGSFRLQ
jgi:hypothetical protein